MLNLTSCSESATIPPAPKPDMSAAAHRLRADRARAAGDLRDAALFDFYARRADQLEMKATREKIQTALGQNYYLTINAAHFMAACLRSKRMSSGAERWQAQHALEGWLSAIPDGERREILAKLRRCTPTQLGRALAKEVAKYAAE
jgi:hypothetical protein